jgi:metal-responsive CopG/Arc/MetJ family transcriptional regulator
MQVRTITVTVKLPEDLLKSVDKLADSAKTTRSEVIRRSVSLYQQVQSAEREGKVLVLMPKERVEKAVTRLLLVET